MRRQKYSIVALDIDGTLIDDRQYIAAATIACIGRVTEAGALVVLATGKSSFAALSTVRALRLGSGICIASDGAVTFSFEPFEVIGSYTFEAAPVISAALQRFPEALIGVEHVGKGYRVNRPFPPGGMIGEIKIEPLDKLSAEKATRVVVRDPAAPAGSYEMIGPAGVSKATALSHLASRFHIPREQVLAIGDGANDIEMLSWAGRGVAMGNACEEAKAAADAVTDSLKEGGVITELSRWF